MHNEKVRNLRSFVLSDESLYLQAREYGGGGDDEMYEKLDDFCRKHRKTIEDRIRDVIQAQRPR